MKWAEDVESKLDMECTMIEGDDEDVLEFTRSGVDGRMTIAATFFDVQAKLGFLLKPFLGTIEAEVRKQLEEALAKEEAKASRPAGARKTGARKK
ncbi:MAG: polyhydroxyalkanoic acid system family protein [Burkholderiales bacterium]|nr:polyhydroxyalkanoic acid system family protein [Burkholderiales bacterium]